MPVRPESEFPTIANMRDALTKLVGLGLGDHPVQILVVPDSTLQAVARSTGGPGYDGKRPAMMIELEIVDGRLPASLISTDRLIARPVAVSMQ